MKIFGVDFSGAADAGRKIWVTRGVVVSGGLLLEESLPARRLSGGASTRAEALGALRHLIESERDAAFGLDFAFGLPKALVIDSSWPAFAANFASQFGQPAEFQRWCWEQAGKRELRRETDEESKTPFSVYNLRMFRQTYYGIRDVLAPLVRDRAASVVPMQSPCAGRPWLLEICPASTLKAEGHYGSYKAASAQQERRRLVDFVLGAPGITANQGVRMALLEDVRGDALDSAIAAWATFRAVKSEFKMPRKLSTAWKVEGYVFA